MNDWKPRMNKAVRHLAEQLVGIRTGTVDPALVASVRASVRGNSAPVGKLAAVTVRGADRLLVRPFDPAGTDLARSRTARIQVDERLRIPGREGAFAIGDAASVTDGGTELPMLSPPAMQAGRYVARLIAGAARGRPIDDAKPFRYVDKGTMATIGRNAAVAQLWRLRLRGFLGWAAWLTVHLWYIVGFRNRLAVFSRWAWTYLRKDRPIRLIMRVEADQVTDELVADFEDRELEIGGKGP